MGIAFIIFIKKNIVFASTMHPHKPFYFLSILSIAALKQKHFFAISVNTVVQPRIRFFKGMVPSVFPELYIFSLQIAGV